MVTCTAYYTDGTFKALCHINQLTDKKKHPYFIENRWTKLETHSVKLINKILNINKNKIFNILSHITEISACKRSLNRFLYIHEQEEFWQVCLRIFNGACSFAYDFAQKLRLVV